MNQYIAFLFVFAVGFMGFLVFHLLKFPGGALIGSIVATGILNATGHYPEFPTRLLSFCAKAATGVMLGRQIDRQLFTRLKKIAPYVLFSTVGMFAMSLLTGYAIYKLTGVSLLTSLIAGAAGGITEMTTFGMSVNADVVVIIFVQMFRLVTFLVLTPYIAMLVEKLAPRKPAVVLELQDEDQKTYFGKKDYVLLCLAGLSGAWLVGSLDIPNGVIIGAMFACGALALLLKKTYRFDSRVRYAIQISLGMIMGQRITPQIAAELSRLLLPAIAVTILMIAGSTLLAFVLYRISPLDPVTCILCTSPAGLSQVTIFAEEIGSDAFTTSVFHMARLLSIVSLYPWIVMMLT